MPDKQRTFEVDAQHVPGLNVQPRQARKKEDYSPGELKQSEMSEQAQTPNSGRSYTRRV